MQSVVFLPIVKLVFETATDLHGVLRRYGQVAPVKERVDIDGVLKRSGVIAEGFAFGQESHLGERDRRLRATGRGLRCGARVASHDER